MRYATSAALLHDTGKLGISKRILGKPGCPTDEEFEKIKEHTTLTYGILNRVSPSRYLADLAASHHERLDGSGYHRSLSEKDLDTSARILAVANVFTPSPATLPTARPCPSRRSSLFSNPKTTSTPRSWSSCAH